MADSMEPVLSDGKIPDELARTEKTVWQKIKDFITKIIADIRYSIDDTPETPDVSDSAATDRDLLLAMAEQLVGSEEENRLLANYKTNYDTQKARQARLDELTAKMREQQSILLRDRYGANRLVENATGN